MGGQIGPIEWAGVYLERFYELSGQVQLFPRMSERSRVKVDTVGKVSDLSDLSK